MDFDKTEQLYEEIGQKKKFEETADYNRYRKEKKWFETVKSKRTGEFFQADYLLQKDMLDKKWTPPHVDAEGKPLTYPLKYVNGIYRVPIADGTEWLLSTQEWIALSGDGNPVNLSMNYKERYDDIRPVYTSKPKNPKERDTEMIMEISSIQHKMKHTLPFTPENVDSLWAKGNGKCGLVLKDETQDKPPYSIPKLESFKNSSFPELFEWAINS